MLQRIYGTAWQHEAGARRRTSIGWKKRNGVTIAGSGKELELFSVSARRSGPA